MPFELGTCSLLIPLPDLFLMAVCLTIVVQILHGILLKKLCQFKVNLSE